MALPAEEVGYTFADLLSWDEKERIEIIDGEAFMMATPSRIHQAISMELSRQLANFLEGKQCRVYPAPLWRSAVRAGQRQSGGCGHVGGAGHFGGMRQEQAGQVWV